MTRYLQPVPRPDRDGEEAERRLSELSRIYFSSAGPVGDEPQPANRPERTSVPPPAVGLWNAAGPAGEVFLDAVASGLERRGRPVLQAWARAESYRTRETGEEALTGPKLWSTIQGRDEIAFTILRFDPGAGAGASAVFRACDVALVLADQEVQSLVAAFGALKAWGSAAPPPVVLYRGSSGDLWDRIAPLRLAEAAVRFLNSRISIWCGGSAEGVARRLESLAERPRGRPEREACRSRLAEALGGS